MTLLLVMIVTILILIDGFLQFYGELEKVVETELQSLF